MNIKDEIKNIAIHEAKSGYHKARLVGAVGEKALKLLGKQAKFISRYVKELKNEAD